MADNSKETPQAIKPALKRRTSKWIIPGGVLAAIALLLGYCQTLERPFLTRTFEYEVINTITDQDTGKIVELGRLYNFSSEAYEVGIYDTLNPNRESSELKKPVFEITSPVPIPEKIEFDGKCYFVRTAFEKDWTHVRGTWKDPKTGKSLCFYLLTPDGKRIENY
jgi:hypothetical protein